jgi:hypothetical protein
MRLRYQREENGLCILELVLGNQIESFEVEGQQI